MGRRIKDNQLELVFEGGKVIIPPLIHDRAEIRELINRMPAEVRDDGVPRAGRGDVEAQRAVPDLGADVAGLRAQRPVARGL